MPTVSVRERIFGVVALWLALAGLIMPFVVMLFLMADAFTPFYDGANSERLDRIGSVVAFSFAMPALVCGMRGCRTCAGKWGLLIGNVALALYLCAWI